MYSNFKEQAIEYLRQAVQEDNIGNYAKAFTLYMNALEYFKTHLKYEKNPEIKEVIYQKIDEYLHRAEEIQAVLDEDRTGSRLNGGNAVVVTSSKPKLKDGEDGEDPEQSKLKTGPNSAIIRNFKDQAIAYVKQAVQEDGAGNYAKAFPLYMNALEYFKTHLKYEKNPKIKEAITTKFDEYLHRAEEIRTLLYWIEPSMNEGDAVVATSPKDGKGGDDPQQSKLNAGLNSEIISNFKQKAIEYVKEAVQEDNAGNYAKALPLYVNALEHFRAHLKYEKDDPKMKMSIFQKMREYMHRAEKIRMMLDAGTSGSSPSGGDAVVATRPTDEEDGKRRDF